MKHFNAETAIVRSPAKIGTLPSCQSTSKWLVSKIWLMNIPNVMDVINKDKDNLQGQLLGVQQLIFLVNSSFFPEFGIIFQILSSRYLKFFRQLLTVLIGPVVKFVCNRRL